MSESQRTLQPFGTVGAVGLTVALLLGSGCQPNESSQPSNDSQPSGAGGSATDARGGEGGTSGPKSGETHRGGNGGNGSVGKPTSATGGASASSNNGSSGGSNANGGAVNQVSGGASPQGGGEASAGKAPSGGTAGTAGTPASGGTAASITSNPLPVDGIPVGNPDGHCTIPAGYGVDSIGTPTQVVGDGTKASCTGAAVVSAIWNEGKPVNRVTFNCGQEPLTITLSESIKIPNAPSGASTIIDGGNKVTLSGGGKVRILYANACNNALGWYTSHCDDQDSPRVTVQNLTFIDGNAAGIAKSDVDEPSGGAIFMRSGLLKIVNCRFFNNRAINSASDFGGGAVRVLGQYDEQPVIVVNSTFGGKTGYGNSAANGGAIASIGTSWHIINSLFTDNTAIGTGASSGNGGNGGGIYNDGNFFNLELCGTKMERNVANEGGGAIFFVSNDNSGTISILNSALTANVSKGFGEKGLYIQTKSGNPVTTGSTIE